MNLVPFTHFNAFLPSIISLFILLSFLQYNLSNMIQLRLYRHEALSLYLGITFFSISGIIASFVIGNMYVHDFAARYLVNCVYLLTITLGVLVEFTWENYGVVACYAIALILGLFLSSSWISNFHYMVSPDFKIKDNGALDTIAFLQRNGLSYGYGPYWGSNANGVTRS